MRLAINSRNGAEICDWDAFALLRDNVQHYVEGGRQGGRFRALHAIARAVDEGYSAVDAVRLRVEVLQAWQALAEVEQERAAVSTRTRSVRDGRPIPPADSLTDVERPFGSASGGAEVLPVCHAAEPFIAAVLGLTRAAVAGDLLEVRRVPND